MIKYGKGGKDITAIKFFNLPDYSVGEQYKSKISKIVSYIKKKGADYLFITASENNAWLLNIRGGDSKFAPIPQSYILIDKNKKLKFFCNLKKTSPSFKKKFKEVQFIEAISAGKILSQIEKRNL